MINSIPKHSGIYFVKDNINNLRIKIHFNSINTLLKLPKCTVPELNIKGSIPIETHENATADDEKCVVIKWQQKLFSSDECALYSDLKNCTNDQHRKYHELLKEKGRSKKQTKKKRQRKQAKTEDESTTSSESHFIFTYVQEDNFSASSKLDENFKPFAQDPFEEMFIYAALNPDTQLAVLYWFNRDRLLYIYPDFTDFEDHPYIIEIDSDYRHLYSYGMTDVSLKALPATNDQQQFLYLPELPTHWRIEDELVKQFAMPPKRTQRCAIIFSINNISGFEYDNVHIRYSIKLPENTILEEGLLDATSHSTTISSATLSLHIGLTWQITLLCEEQFDKSQHLLIFFEVISIDSWERERTEGYAYYSLQLLQPRQCNVNLKCLRPVETCLEAINRYFIGGRRKFNYERFVCERTNDNEEESVTNFYCRYGERMQSSGQIRLSCQIIIQRSSELINHSANFTNGMSLDDIMMAYKEARRRLEALTLN